MTIRSNNLFSAINILNLLPCRLTDSGIIAIVRLSFSKHVCRIVNKQLAILAIPARLVSSDADNTKYTLCLTEDQIHFFQWSICRLWIEEVYTRPDYGVDNGENSIGIVLDRGEENRRDENYYEVEKLRNMSDNVKPFGDMKEKGWRLSGWDTRLNLK